MLKKLGLLLVSLFMVFGISTKALAEAKIAVVDVQQVVASSSQVQALKKDRQAKADEIVKFLEKARQDLSKITDANKKKTAEEKYNKELQTKRDKMDKDYADKLQAIDTAISKQIETYAKAQGFDAVLSKNIVLFGGKDITAEIIKAVK